MVAVVSPSQRNSASGRLWGMVLSASVTSSVGVGVSDDFAAYVAARGPARLRLAYVLTGDPADAEDVVQDALARALPRWSQISRAQDVDAYVRRMVVNAHVSWWRRSGAVSSRSRPYPRKPATLCSTPRKWWWPGSTTSGSGRPAVGYLGTSGSRWSSDTARAFPTPRSPQRSAAPKRRRGRESSEASLLRDLLGEEGA